MERIVMRNPVPSRKNKHSVPLIKELNRLAGSTFYNSDLTADEIAEIFESLSHMWSKNHMSLTTEKFRGRRFERTGETYDTMDGRGTE